MVLLLELHDVDDLLDMHAAIEATQAAFAQQGNRHVLSQPPTMLRAPQGYFRSVVGGLLESKLLGTRLGAAGGFHGGSTLAALFELETGRLVALMPYPFGALRTAATVAVATMFLARADAHVVGLLGAGRSAMTLLEGTMCVRDIREVKVYSPNTRQEFARRARAELGLDVRACDGPTDVVRGSDVLLVVTNSRQPVFGAADVESGLHVGSMGQPHELAVDVYRRADLVIVGDRSQELELGMGVTHPLAELDPDDSIWRRTVELGDVVAGRAGRKDREQITVFRESQGGWGDVALAEWALARAKERGLGREVDL